MPSLRDLIVDTWTHVAKCNCAHHAAVVRLAAELSLAGKWLDVPLAVSGDDARRAFLNPLFPIKDDVAYQIWPDDPDIAPEYRGRANELQQRARSLYEQVASGEVSLIRWDGHKVDMSRIDQPECIGVRVHMEQAFTELQNGDTFRQRLDALAAWEWLVNEIVSACVIPEISGPVLIAYAELSATGDLQQSTAKTAELARLNSAGLGDKLAAGLLARFPDVAVAIGLTAMDNTSPPGRLAPALATTETDNNENRLDMAPLSPTKLAEVLGVPVVGVKALEKRLARWRKKNRGSDGWIQNSEAKGRDARFLYSVGIARPFAEAIKARILKTSREKNLSPLFCG